MAAQRNRPAYQGSSRRSRLPSNWEELREQGRLLNPQQICHRCQLPGGTTFDHKRPGDDHRQENLDWIHDWRDVKAGRSKVNCHGRKTGAEAAAGRGRLHDGGEPHPAFG